MKRVIKISKISLILFIGIVLGIAMGFADPEVKEVEKIVEVEKVVEKEVEKIVEVEKTPQACLDIIEIDNQILSDVSGYFTKTGAVALEGDVLAFLEASSKESVILTDKVDKVSLERAFLLEECK